MLKKGEEVCGNLKCDKMGKLESYEVNFVYKEKKVKKNTLVKVRLCGKCSIKLNYKKAHKRLGKPID